MHKEIVSHHKRPFNKVYEEFKTHPDIKIATGDLRNLGKGCLKLRMKFDPGLGNWKNNNYFR